MDCTTCGKSLSFWGTLKAMNTKRCDDCNARYQQIVAHWKTTIEHAFTQGGVPKDMEHALYFQFNETHVPEDLAQPVFGRVRHLRHLSEIRWGNVPIIHTDFPFETEQPCSQYPQMHQ